MLRAMPLPPGRADETVKLLHTDPVPVPQVRLLLVALDVIAVGAGEHLPVEILQIVAGHVLAMVRELDGESVKRAFMKAVDEALDDQPRDERRERELVQNRGIEIAARGRIVEHLGDDARVASLDDLVMETPHEIARAIADRIEQRGGLAGSVRHAVR